MDLGWRRDLHIEDDGSVSLALRILAILATLVISHRHGDPGGGGGGGLACDLGPYTSSTAVSTLTSIINTASDGDVICLQRGQTWTAAAGLNPVSLHPSGTRVTICASTGSSCSDSGAANPKITITAASGNCVAFGGSSGGYTFKNLDCTAPSNSTGTGYTFPPGSKNVTVEGGVITGFKQFWTYTGESATPADSIYMGTCASPVEATGTPVDDGSHRAAVYGSSRNSKISVYMHDADWYRTDFQDHMLDITDFSHSTSACEAFDGACSVNNLTVECSHFVDNAAHSNRGAYFKFAKGMTLTFRDNLIEHPSGSCADHFINFATHNDTGGEGWDGAEIYRNYFNYGACSPIGIFAGRNINIYDNVANLATGAFQRGFVQFDQTQPSTTGNLQIDNVAIYQNTIYRPGSTPGSGDYPIIGDNGGAPAADRDPGTNLSVYNNLFYVTAASNPEVWGTAEGQTCNGYGTNGANIHDNYVYSPNAVPSLWSGCSGAARNSNQSPHTGAYTTAPNLTTVPPAVLADFRPTAHAACTTGAPCLCGFSTAANPSTDYDSAAFPVSTPFDVGAFKCP